jgi:acyl carrier protein
VRRTPTRAAFERELLQLIAVGLSSRRRKPGPVAVDVHTPLFDSGLVDSLAILELIAYVEIATGRTIRPREVRIAQFGTIERICAAFWREEDGVNHEAT